MDGFMEVGKDGGTDGRTEGRKNGRTGEKGRREECALLRNPKWMRGNFRKKLSAVASYSCWITL